MIELGGGTFLAIDSGAVGAGFALQVAINEHKSVAVGIRIRHA